MTLTLSFLTSRAFCRVLSGHVDLPSVMIMAIFWTPGLEHYKQSQGQLRKKLNKRALTMIVRFTPKQDTMTRKHLYGTCLKSELP